MPFDDTGPMTVRELQLSRIIRLREKIKSLAPGEFNLNSCERCIGAWGVKLFKTRGFTDLADLLGMPKEPHSISAHESALLFAGSAHGPVYHKEIALERLDNHAEYIRSKISAERKEKADARTTRPREEGSRDPGGSVNAPEGVVALATGVA